MKYPILKPIPIKTKGLSYWKKMKIWLTSSRTWEVVEDYYFEIPWLGVIVKIPKGFVFDGASIPKLFWPLLSPTGLLFIPGLFHDYGYKYNYWIDATDNKIYINAGQKFFDNQFRKLGVYINDMKILDKVAWVALRGFGWIAWKKHRKEEVKYEK
jgi:hypothetical protein